MFGLILSSRPPLTSPTAITETQYAFRIPQASGPAFNHIVLFLLPGTALPPGTAATVWIQIPPSTEFKLLGGLGIGKESAIFKVSGAGASGGAVDGEGDVMVDEPAATANGAGAEAGGADTVVGISIEPIAAVESQLANLKAQQASNATALVKATPTPAGNVVSTKVLAQRIIGNAFNFLASFGSDTVPLKAFQDWWAKFEKKIELDPTFLEREGG